ncbi:ATPase inhibitor [Yarrowia sp. B02]|nr:ATPase inhibitor [Yarrowia sp. B02]
MLSRISTATVTRVPRVAARFYSEGSAGSFRGEGQGDSFTKREKAQEDYYVKQQEKEKLEALREQLAKLKQDTADLEKHLDSKK